jgi:hypothetical protein
MNEWQEMSIASENPSRDESIRIWVSSFVPLMPVPWPARGEIAIVSWVC